MLKGLAVLVIFLSGCDLYFGGDDEPPCEYDYGAAKPDIAPQEVRNPETGMCEYGGGGGGWCDDRCGPCPAGAAEPVRDWGVCYGSCYGLGESACFNTSGCYAAYLDDPATLAEDLAFWGCWNTAPSGPVQGSCTNLTAYECSRHDNCIAIYDGKSDGNDSTYERAQFQACRAETIYEPNACDVIDCGPGYTCEQQCTADKGYCSAVCVNTLTCASVDCGPGYTCSTACSTAPDGKVTCGPLCVASTTCEALTDEAACLARNDCTPVYDGQDCTCYPSGCECKILTYNRCE